jgi:hypothetical protein
MHVQLSDISQLVQGENKMPIQMINVAPRRSKKQHTDYNRLLKDGHEKYNQIHDGIFVRVNKNVRDFRDDLGEI